MTNPKDLPTDVAAVLQELDGALRRFFQSRVAAADAEDLVQECYLRVSPGLSGLQDHERVAGWVFKIARNFVVDFIRGKNTRSVAKVEPLHEEDHAQVSEEPNLALQMGQWLVATIDQLPEKYVKVLRESEVKERTHKEIAAELGISVSGVKSRVQRGRALLREKLNACCLLEFDRRGGLHDATRRDAQSTSDCDADCCR